MGLDGVELIMAYEARFDIEIPDEAACKLLKVGDAYDYVIRTLKDQGRFQEESASTSCLTMVLFHRLRRSGMNLFHWPRERFKPATQLSQLFPARNHLPQNWKAWAGQSEVILPPLRVPLYRSPSFWILLTLCGGILLAEFILRQTSKGIPWAAAGLVPFQAILSVELIRWNINEVRQRRKELFPADGYTVRDLVKDCAEYNSRIERAPDDGRWTAEEVWAYIVLETEQQLGLDRNLIRKESRFVEELGVG